MKIAVVINGISLAKDVFYKRYLPRLQAEFDVEVSETRSVNDAVAIAAKLRQRRIEVIVAAGGDGTINQIVNGLLNTSDLNRGLPILAVLPLGSGNDFARAFDHDHAPSVFLERLKLLRTKEIDIGEVHYSVSPPQPNITSIQDKRFFVNVVDVGMGPPVVRGVLDSGRAFGSAFAYYQSILKTFFTYHPLMLEAKTQEWTWQSKMRTFAIANGKYFGNGLCIAPDALTDDGIFEIFACGPVSVLDFIIQSAPLKQGKKLNHSQVSYFRAKEIELTSPSAIEIEADGEIIGWLPAKVIFSQQKLTLLD